MYIYLSYIFDFAGQDFLEATEHVWRRSLWGLQGAPVLLLRHHSSHGKSGTPMEGGVMGRPETMCPRTHS